MRAAGKGGGNEIKIFCYTESEVFPVSVADEWKRQVGTRDVNSFVGRDNATVFDNAEDVRVRAGLHPQFNQPIVDQDGSARVNFFG